MTFPKRVRKQLSGRQDKGLESPMASPFTQKSSGPTRTGPIAVFTLVSLQKWGPGRGIPEDDTQNILWPPHRQIQIIFFNFYLF